jgi:hypothetical protein
MGFPSGSLGTRNGGTCVSPPERAPTQVRPCIFRSYGDATRNQNRLQQ